MADGPGTRGDPGVDPEIEYHLEMQARRYIASGLHPDEARARARARLGDLERAQAASRAISIDMEAPVTRLLSWSSLVQDARFAIRVLRGSPLFTITALFTMGLGIGAATAIFSVVNAVLIKPLPYPTASRIVVIFNGYQQKGLGHAAVSPEEFADLVAGASAFDRLAAVRPQVTTLTGACSAGPDCEPERLNAYVVSPALFDVLGVAPAPGRGFAQADGAAGAAPVVLLSEPLWRRRFGADPSIVGRTILLGGVPRQVVGVMPESVRFPDEPVGYLKARADAWIPRNWEDVKDGRGNQYLVVLGRLKPGTPFAVAEAGLASLAANFRARFPNRYAPPKVKWSFATVALRDEMFGDVRPALLLLLGAVGCVLLIACANVANLTVARGTTRRRELAVRSALGADRRRLVQQLMIETLMLTGAGAGIGILIAEGGLRSVIAINPDNVPGLDAARIDAAVLLFAVALAAVTGVLVGLVPALGQSQTDPQSALADGTRGAGVSSSRRRVRALLVVVEVALAVVVLVGAGLLVRSFVGMARVPTGFSTDRVITAHIALPRASYTPAARAVAFQRALIDRIATMPGVTHASAVYPLPMSDDGWSGTIFVDGRGQRPGEPEPHAEYAVAHPGYFETMGIALREGREFAATDTAGAPSVGIVDEEFAKTYWPGESAVGKRVSPFGDPGATGQWTTIVGVAAHVRNRGARAGGEPQFYFCALQKAEYGTSFVARTEIGPGALAPAIRAAVREIDPALPIASLRSMDDVLVRFTARERFNLALFTIFGVVALALSGVGLYGVLASLVSQRAPEIGIRLALGGRPTHIVRGVLGEGVGTAAVGLVLGLASAAGLSRLMETMLFEVTPVDPITYVSIAGVVLVVSIAASIWPARRAMSVDPVEILRRG